MRAAILAVLCEVALAPTPLQAVPAVLFTIGKTAIGIYIGRSQISSGFGAAGALIVLLVWIYYSSLILLLGAEFTRAFAQLQGSHRGPRPASLQPRATAAPPVTERLPSKTWLR
jgi:membrane protein